MPGTTYHFELTLSGDRALASARDFRTALQAELSKMSVAPTIDIKAMQQQAQQGVGAAAESAAKSLGTKYDNMMDSMVRSAGSMGPQMKKYFDEALSLPADQAKEKVKALSGQMEKFADATKKLGLTPAEFVDMGKMDRWFAGLQAAQRQVWGVRSFGYQVQKYGRGMMAGGMAVLGGAAMAGREYIQFAAPLGRAARNMELNAQMTELLDQKLRDLAGTVSLFSPEEQAEGLYLWAAATGEVAETEADLDAVLQRTDAVQKLAKLGYIDLGTAVEATTDILSQYQLDVNDTERVTATLVKVAAVSKAEVGDLAAAFVYAGARAEQSNTSFEETAATLQVLSAFGMRGSMAGRGLSRLFENLIAPSEIAQRHLDELFQTVFGRTDVLINAKGQFVGIASAIDTLAAATEDLTEAERAAFIARITTQNAARVAIPLIELQIEARKRQVNAIEAVTNIINGTVGTHEQAFLQMMEDIYGYEMSAESAAETFSRMWGSLEESVEGRTAKIQARFSAAMDTIGKSVVTAALPFVEDLAAAIGGVAEKIGAMDPKTVSDILKYSGLAVGIGALITILGKGITLYADVKAILIAKNLVQAANTQLIASENMLLAAGVQGKAAGVSTTAGTMGLFAVLRKLAPVAAMILTVDQGSGREAGFEMGKVVEPFITTPEEEALVFGPYTPGQYRTQEQLQEAYMTRSLIDSQYYLTEMGRKLLEETGFQPSAKGPASLEEILRLFAELGISGASDMLAEITAGAEEMEAALQDLDAAAVETTGTLVDTLAGGVLPTVDELQMRVIEGLGGFQPELETWLSQAGDLAAKVQGEMTRMVAEGLISEDVAAKWLARYETQLVEFWQRTEGMTQAELDKETAYFWKSWEERWGWLEEQADLMESGKSRIVDLLGMGASREEVQALLDDYMLAVIEFYEEHRELTGDALAIELELFNAYWDARFAITEDRLDEERKAEEDAAKDAEKAWKDALDQMERDQQTFRQSIAGMLKPTDVTVLDVLETDAGTYQDKWDEWARQLRAAVQGSPEWEWMLPAHVKEMDEAGRKAWGQRTLEQFYSGMMPDKINWDAFAAQYEQMITEKVAGENLLDIAEQELRKRGIDPSRADVRRALGMPEQSPLVSAYLGGLDPKAAGTELQAAIGTAMSNVDWESEDLTEPSEDLVAAFSAGFGEYMEGPNWTQKIADVFNADLDLHHESLGDVGGRIGSYIFDGMLETLRLSGFVQEIVDLVLLELEKD